MSGGRRADSHRAAPGKRRSPISGRCKMAVSIFLVAIASAACANEKHNAAASTSSPMHYPKTVHTGKFGISCLTELYPSTAGPPSYSVKDVGKIGVPRLSAFQTRMIYSIEHYRPLSSLRFAILAKESKDSRFIVFEADDGPCLYAAPGYQVLNVYRAFYQPGLNPFFLHGGPDAVPTLGPWMKN